MIHDTLIMVRMPSELRRDLEELAAKEYMTLSEYCRQTLKERVRREKKRK